MTDPSEKERWQCLRCLWILGGREGEEIPEHAQQCPFRDTGEDPSPEDLQVGGASATRPQPRVKGDE
jgi:hypothetical protein